MGRRRFVDVKRFVVVKRHCLLNARKRYIVFVFEDSQRTKIFVTIQSIFMLMLANFFLGYVSANDNLIFDWFATAKPGAKHKAANV